MKNKIIFGLSQTTQVGLFWEITKLPYTGIVFRWEDEKKSGESCLTLEDKEGIYGLLMRFGMGFFVDDLTPEIYVVIGDFLDTNSIIKELEGLGMKYDPKLGEVTKDWRVKEDTEVMEEESPDYKRAVEILKIYRENFGQRGYCIRIWETSG